MTEFVELIKQWLFIPGFRISDVFEICVIAVLIYWIITFARKTKTGALIFGLVLLVVLYGGTKFFNMTVLAWLMEKTFSVGLVAVIILFQAELRKLLEKLGIMFSSIGKIINNDSSSEFSDETVNAIVDAAFEMGQVKMGALIVIERELSLEDYENTGIRMDAEITPQLLIQIFEHNTPLHDGAVIIRGNRIASATCYLPLSHNMDISKDLGTRHRAGIGISEETDCFTIIASEESGAVSLAVGGELIHNISKSELHNRLEELQVKENERGEKRNTIRRRNKKKVVKKTGE